MRIGIDIRVVNAEESGQQRYLGRLGHWLAESGHEVHFLTVRDQPDGMMAPTSVVLHRLERHSRSELRRAVTELSLDTLLLNPERSRRYRGLPANVLRAAYGTDQYQQKIRSFRGPLERGARRALRATPWTVAERRWERAFYEVQGPAPDVIAQSAYMRDQILNSYHIPADHVHVIHNAVDSAEYSPEKRTALRAEMRARWSIPEESVCLLFLGHNFRLKGLWQVLDVLARLAPDRPDVHLLVAGRGTGEGQRRKARRLVEAHHLGDRVTLAGPVQTSLHALAASDALLHLSWHDSFGYVVLEAMACGLPVVTTPYVGASELIEDRISGVLVDPARDSEVAAAIESLSSPRYRDAIGAAASTVARQHDEESNFKRVLEVLEVAADRRSGPLRL